MECLLEMSGASTVSLGDWFCMKGGVNVIGMDEKCVQERMELKNRLRWEMSRDDRGKRNSFYERISD